MATNVKGADAKNETADMEAVKAQAVAAYKQRVASMNGVFEGLGVSAEDVNKFIEDETKSVADATAHALSLAKETIKKIEESVEAKIGITKAEPAPAVASAAPAPVVEEVKAEVPTPAPVVAEPDEVKEEKKAAPEKEVKAEKKIGFFGKIFGKK